MSARRAYALVFLAWLASVLMWLTPGITRPDGVGYFQYLPSVVLGGDLLFFDEWRAFGLQAADGHVQHKEITATNHLGNHWTVGSALAWSPAYLVADRVAEREGLRNGISLPYNVAVVAASAVAALIALTLIFRITRKFASPAAAAASALLVWFGTPLLFYSTRSAITAHALTTCAAGAVLSITLMLRATRSRAGFVALGLALGFAFAVRPQNALLVLLPLFVIEMGELRDSLREAAFTAVGAAVAVLPQLVVSAFVYGDLRGFLGVGGAAATPFAALQRIWWWEPLFSWYHGLLWWTPVAFMGIAGLASLMRTDRRLATGCLSVIVAQWLVNATLERSFWGATSFGQRRFDSCIPLFAVGIAALLATRTRILWAVMGTIGAAWTMLLFLAAGRGLDLSRYVAPDATFAAAASSLSRGLELLRLFAFVKSGRGSQVALYMSLTFALYGAVALFAVFILRTLRQRVIAATLFFLLASAILFRAGSHDAARLPRYAAVIEQSRRMQSLPGGADERSGLLRDELSYLEATGRESDAARTRAELDALQRARAAALQRMGVQR